MSAAPTIALDHGFTPAAFAPGRYATAIQRTMHGTHDLQVLDEDSTSSFVLELAAGGAATACRGWRYVFRNDGPDIHTEDNYREQQGYRGHYTVVDGVAEAVLDLDSSVCPHVFEGGLVLARASRLTLRCVVAMPSRNGQLTDPVLLCRPHGDKSSELDPYVVEQIISGGWFALGSGNGLRMWLTGRPTGAQEGDDVQAKLRVADAPLTASAWERSF
ncbi:MAG: hypothetical protein E6J90_41305 [Deltaproteobacteria bacterium]|nr:MAG: hypothetical protein E6J90_41305 [Deltaproteobacteria bacterium]TMQ16901.1 MAG: hypothetical protein E6J91_10985 [Deltaproteobacteria bacterium]